MLHLNYILNIPNKNTEWVTWRTYTIVENKWHHKKKLIEFNGLQSEFNGLQSNSPYTPVQYVYGLCINIPCSCCPCAFLHSKYRQFCSAEMRRIDLIGRRLLMQETDRCICCSYFSVILNRNPRGIQTKINRSPNKEISIKVSQNWSLSGPSKCLLLQF